MAEQKQSLFNLSHELRNLLENFDQIDDDANAAAIEEIKGLLSSKTDAVAEYHRVLKYEIDIAKAELDRIKAIYERRQKRLARYQEYILTCMDALQESKLKGELSSVTVRKPSRAVEIYDEKKLPINFVFSETVTKVDKAGIKEALKNGEIIDGAKLVDGKRGLTIK